MKEEIEKALEARGEWIGKIPLEIIQGISPYNARKHRIEENIEELENAVGLTSEVRDALTLNQDFQIVKGQRRYIVAKRWNFKEVPVIIRKYPDKLLELLDSRNENQLTYPLCSDDEADVIYTLAKAWGEEKTSQYIGRSIAYVSNIVRFREAPEPVKEALEGTSMKVKKMGIAFLKDVLKKEGPEKTLEVGKVFREMPDRDQEQAVKDYRAGEKVDFHGRYEKAKVKTEEYDVFTIRILRIVSSYLNKVARNLKKDKTNLINNILKSWMEEHSGLAEA